MTHEITTAASALALFETTKAQRESFAASIMESINEGHLDPLKVHMQAKCNEQLLKLLMDSAGYKAAVLEAAQKYGKSFDLYNASFQVKEAGTTWDYSKTGDYELERLEAEAAELKAKIDARKKFLQTIPEAGIVDPETGVMIYRAFKSSTTTVSCTLK